MFKRRDYEKQRYWSLYGRDEKSGLEPCESDRRKTYLQKRECQGNAGYEKSARCHKEQREYEKKPNYEKSRGRQSSK